MRKNSVYGDLQYDYQKEVGEVFINQNFVEIDRVIQLDILSDWINQLESFYNSILENKENLTIGYEEISKSLFIR